MVDALMDWGSTWSMKLNAKSVTLCGSRVLSEILQEVPDAKYLGIQIDNELDWDKHISAIAARGQSKLAFLNKNLKGCPKS